MLNYDFLAEQFHRLRSKDSHHNQSHQDNHLLYAIYRRITSYYGDIKNNKTERLKTGVLLFIVHDTSRRSQLFFYC